MSGTPFQTILEANSVGPGSTKFLDVTYQQLSNCCAAQGSGGGDFRCRDLQRWIWLYGVSLPHRHGPLEDDELFGAR